MLNSFLIAAVAATAAPQSTPATVPSDQIMSAVTGEWSGDGNPDHAVLLLREDIGVDLLIYRSDR